MSPSNSPKNGFTLVELSLVIVIIGLLVSAVFAGRSLMEQAKLRKVLSDIESIRLLTNTFKLEYDELPGDLSNATSYWGNPGSGGANNGNGNRRIDNRESPVSNLDPVKIENYAAWRHLQLAKLYPNLFTGTGSHNPSLLWPNDTNPRLGVKLPEAALSGRWYNFWHHSGANDIYGKSGNAINLNGGSSLWWNSAVSAKEAASLDTKADDGAADTGIISSAKGADFSGQNDRCTLGTNNHTASSATYNPADTGLHAV